MKKDSSGTLFASNTETKNTNTNTMNTQVKQQGKVSTADWKAFLETLDAELASKLKEVIAKNKQVFETASEENKLAVVQKLARIFSFSLDDYKISTERVFLMLLRNGYVTVSLHYLVYLRLAASFGVDFVSFQPIEVFNKQGEKIVLEKDNKQKDYYLLFSEFENRGGVWKTHFSIMFRKTLAKQALMFLYPAVFENSILSELVTYDEDDLVVNEPQTPRDATSATFSTVKDAKPALSSDFRKKHTKLYAKINANKAVFSNIKELLDEFETFLKLKNYKSVVDIIDEEDLKFAHALSESLKLEAESKTSFKDAMDLREKVLIRLQSSTKKADMRADILKLLAESGYETISEVGNFEVLKKLNKIIESYEATQA